jgi:hypothetical protein
MGEIGDGISYTMVALGFAVLIFVGALFFVQAARRGNRRFKWGRQSGNEPATPEAGTRRTRER